MLDGARIQFSATGGSIDGVSYSANGFTQAVFISDAAVGAVEVTARSGNLGE